MESLTLEWITGEEMMRHIQSGNGGHDTAAAPLVEISDDRNATTEQLLDRNPRWTELEDAGQEEEEEEEIEGRPEMEWGRREMQWEGWRARQREREREKLLVGLLVDDWVPGLNFTDSLSLFTPVRELRWSIRRPGRGSLLPATAHPIPAIHPSMDPSIHACMRIHPCLAVNHRPCILFP